MIIKLVAGLAAFKVGLGAVQFAFGGLFGPLATAYKIFSKFRTLGVIGKVFSFLRIGALGFGRAMLFVGRALLLNPIGLLVTAVAGAGYLIWKHWDRIKAGFRAGLGYLGQAWNWLKGHAANFLIAFGPLGVAAMLVIKHWNTIKAAFSSALSWIGGLVSRFVGIGRAIIDGLVSGILAAPGKIWAALKSTISAGWQKAKEYLGIASPSRLFATMGGHISSGLAMGIDRGGRQPIGSMKRLAAGVAAAGAMSLSPAGAASAGAARGPAPGAAGDTWHIEVKIQTRDGQSAEDIADEVIDKIEKKLAVRKRSSFDDQD
jgi:hypothetical protein